jgi:hypothetical protein
MGEDLFQVVFVLIALLVAFLQWLFKTIRGGDEEEEDRRQWERRTREGRPQQQGEDSGETDEQEAYRRLMEALGIPEEEQQPPPATRREPEPKPKPEPQPQAQAEPEQTRRQQLEERRRAAGDDRNPYTMPYDPEQDRRRKPDQPARTPEPTPRPSFAGKAEEMRRQARRRQEEADRELKKIGEGIDSDHLEKTEIGTAEIGSEAEADFSWDTPTPGRSSSAYGAVSGVSRAYAISRPGVSRRVSQEDVTTMLQDPVSLKKGIVLREVLGPPIGLREKWSNLYHLDY